MSSFVFSFVLQSKEKFIYFNVTILTFIEVYLESRIPYIDLSASFEQRDTARFMNEENKYISNNLIIKLLEAN